MFVSNVENAIVDIRKLRDYCLNPNHDEGRHKARMFAAALGSTDDNAEELKAGLLEAFKAIAVDCRKVRCFRQRYTVYFGVERNGKRATILSIMILPYEPMEEAA